jgi:hypothetical protein
MILHPKEGDPLELESDIISGPYALMVRDGQIRQIDVYFS